MARGPEIEQAMKQEVEILKRHLATINLNIPVKTLELAIVLPKDVDLKERRYPKI